MANPPNQLPAPSKESFDLLLGNAVEYDKQGKYYLAIVAIDQAVIYDINDISTRWWYYFYKARWLWSLGKKEEALKVTNEGIDVIGKPPILLYLKADIILRKDRDYTQAIQLIAETEQYMEATSTNFSSQENDIPTLLRQLEDKIRSETTFKNALSELKLDAAVVKAEDAINIKVGELEKKLDKERTSIIELLGIFTAVMSLIILGGSFTLKLNLKDAISLLFNLALVLISFISFISYIFDSQKPKTFLKKALDVRLFVLVFCMLTIYLSLHDFSNLKIGQPNGKPAINKTINKKN